MKLVTKNCRINLQQKLQMGRKLFRKYFPGGIYEKI